MEVNDIISNVSKDLKGVANFEMRTIITVVVTIVVLFAVYFFINKFKKTFSKSLNLDQNIVKLIHRIFKVIYLFVGFMIISAELGINTNSILAIFSIFGLAVSLSIQNLMSNIANAFSIFTNKPFIIGDFVNIGGVEGTVDDISFMYTKLVTVNEEAVYLNNTHVGTTNIINYTKHSIRRISQTIGISYDAPIDLVKKALRETVDNEELVLKDKDIYIAVSAYADSSINYTVRVYTKKENFITCRDRLLESYKKYFDKYNINIPYPHLTVHMDNEV